MHKFYLSPKVYIHIHEPRSLECLEMKICGDSFWGLFGRCVWELHNWISNRLYLCSAFFGWVPNKHRRYVITTTVAYTHKSGTNTIYNSRRYIVCAVYDVRKRACAYVSRFWNVRISNEEATSEVNLFEHEWQYHKGVCKLSKWMLAIVTCSVYSLV